MILIGGVFETLGVSMLIPAVNAIMQPDLVREKIEKFPALSHFLTQDLQLNTDAKLLCALFGFLIGLYVVKNLYLLLLAYKQNRFIARARNDMISRVMREFLNRPYEEYLGADIPTVFRITDGDIPHTFSLVLALLQLMTECVVSLFLVIYLIRVNWQMTLLLMLVLALLTLWNARVLKKKLNAIGKRNQDIQSRIAKWRIQSIYGLKDVKVLNRQDFFIRNYYESGKVGAELATKYAVLNNLPHLVIETIFMATILGFMMALLTSGQNLSAFLPQLMAFGVAAIRVMPSANRINTYMTEIAYEQPSLDFVYENLTDAMKTNKKMAAERAKVAGGALHLEKEIRLEGITFRYPDGDRNIFTDASMVIPKGKSVGIKGASGAGKSTIVDILLGLLHVQKGKITCDGANIFSNYESWLSQIGYIPQSIYLIDESIRDNIAFGIDEREIDDARIREVAAEAQLLEFIDSLPEGLDTKIGDRGVRLSGGQRQRIGIARALYHNPEILVFDEATSALDNETEAALMGAINSFHGRKTMIIIAHRLNTIENCDLIYEVKGEKITRSSLNGETVYHDRT
ncbi:MAG: ABC transporter ATP-binding protein [Lachnospiraceae bacterium]|nr:ABC transporter ATP-binding protein [Lachnospiraceae bacterium]